MAPATVGQSKPSLAALCCILSGHGGGDAVHGGGHGALRAVGALDGVPVVEHLLAGLRLHAAKDVRVAVDELLAGLVGHVVDIPAAGFFLHARVEDDLHQQVAQLLAQVVAVVLVDGLADLIGLLQHVAADALVRLLAVPGAAAFRAQVGDDVHKVAQAVAVFYLKLRHCLQPLFASSFFICGLENTARSFDVQYPRELFALWHQLHVLISDGAGGDDHHQIDGDGHENCGAHAPARR